MTTGRPSLADLGIGHLFDVVPDPVVIGDVEAGVVFAWNDAASTIFGYSREQAVGMPLDVLVPLELRAAHRAGLTTYASGGGGHLVGSPELVEVPAVCQDGRRIWVELRLASLDATAGAGRYVLAVLRDVTSRREAQDQIALALATSRASNDALRDFVAMVSHDLRAPLAGISMSFDLLSARWEALRPDQRGDILERGRRQTKATLALLDDFLQVSRIEAGQLQSSPVLQRVRPLLEAAADTAGVDVTVDADPDLAAVVDAAQLERAVVNLVANADKYGRPPIVVSAGYDARRLRVAVVDGGDGVPDELRGRLFEKFSRGQATAGTQAGVGLGLAIVAGLMAAAGGSVDYEAVTGGGSRFVLTWPAQDS